MLICDVSTELYSIIVMEYTSAISNVLILVSYKKWNVKYYRVRDMVICDLSSELYSIIVIGYTTSVISNALMVVSYKKRNLKY